MSNCGLTAMSYWANQQENGEHKLRPHNMNLYHIPGCPFSERVEILMGLKGLEGLVEDHEIDISKPRPEWLLAKTGGATALPALEVPEGTLRESMVILRYLEDRFPERPVAQRNPYKHAVESWLVVIGANLSSAGYKMLMNRDLAQRVSLSAAVDEQYGQIDAFLTRHSTEEVFLFEQFGWAETALTPLLKRLWFLEYYEDYVIPERLVRVRKWREACLKHPAAQTRSFDEIIKYYYDYSRGVGGGRLVEDRHVSSFALEPHWTTRPMPPRGKWARAATDEELGLLGQR
ncbi:MAG TPA: glutathione S-transferase family protein [Steroidobacteraceae bacterium]